MYSFLFWGLFCFLLFFVLIVSFLCVVVFVLLVWSLYVVSFSFRFGRYSFLLLVSVYCFPLIVVV